MNIGRVGLAIIGFAVASVSLAAHHSFAMFEMDKDVEYRGVVREWRWQNPHVHFTLDVTKQPGVDPQTVGLWDVEGGSVNIMARQGWTRASYKAGDAIRLVGHPMKDGAKGISLFYAIRPDGTRLYHDIARPKDDVKMASIAVALALGGVVKRRAIDRPDAPQIATFQTRSLAAASLGMWTVAIVAGRLMAYLKK